MSTLPVESDTTIDISEDFDNIGNSTETTSFNKIPETITSYYVGLSISSMVPKDYKKYFNPERHRYRFSNGRIDVSFSKKNLEFDVSELSFEYKIPKRKLPKSSISGKINTTINLSGTREEVKNDTFSKISVKGTIDAKYGILSDNGNMVESFDSDRLNVKIDGLVKVRDKGFKIDIDRINIAETVDGNEWSAVVNTNSYATKYYKDGYLLSTVKRDKAGSTVLKVTQKLLEEITVSEQSRQRLYKGEKFRLKNEDRKNINEDLERQDKNKTLSVDYIVNNISSFISPRSKISELLSRKDIYIKFAGEDPNVNKLVAEDEDSWSIRNPETEVKNLIKLDRLDNAGDLAYIEDNGRSYIYDQSEDLLILIKEKWGDSSADQAAFRGWEDWGYGSRKLRAVEEKTDGGWVIALEENWSGQSEWQVLDVDSDGYISWENSYWGDITNKEYLFEVSGSLMSGDLNGDGAIGVDRSRLTASSLDTNGANVLVDADGYAYIRTSSATEANVVAITDSYGSAVRFNQSWSSQGGGGSSSEEATHAQIDTTGSHDVYKVIVKQTENWSGAPETRYHIHTVNLDGTFDWDTLWDVDLIDYEISFGEDFNGDTVYGFNTDNLGAISTDDDSS